MNFLTRTELELLSIAKHSECISIYLPTHRKGMSTQNDPIVLKNLLKETEEELKKRGHKQGTIDALLSPVTNFFIDVTFWQYQSDGLAIFLSEEGMKYFTVPIAFKESVHVGKQFYVVPLLPLFNGDGQFFILNLSLQGVRLFHASKLSLTEVDTLDYFPASIEDTFVDGKDQQSLNHHNTASGANVHGTSAPEEDQKKAIVRYFRLVHQGLLKLFKKDRYMLVLSGVEYLHPLYKEANNYSALAPKGVYGSMENVSLEVLHTKAWDIVKPLFSAEQNKLFETTKEQIAKGTALASANIKDIIASATLGKIRALFIQEGFVQYGLLNRVTNTVKLHKERELHDENLVAIASLDTLLKGGDVFLVNEKSETPLMALYRY